MINLTLFSVTSLLLTGFAEIAIRIHKSQNPGVGFAELEKYQKIVKDQETTLGNMIYPTGNPRLVYRLIPNLSVFFGGKRMTTNSQGWRDDEFVVKKPENTIRIAVIGDSTTFGWKVAQDESYSEVLESQLNKFSNSKKFEVLNFGVPGYNSVMELETFENFALPMEPDIVLLQFDGNDIHLPNFLQKNPSAWSKDHFYFYELIVNRFSLLNNKWTERKMSSLTHAPTQKTEGGGYRFIDDAEKIPEEYRQIAGLENCLGAIKKIGTTCNEKSIPHYFIMNPSIVEYYHDEKIFSQESYNVDVVTSASSAGFQIVDPTLRIKNFLVRHKLLSQHLWIDPSVTDSHPSPARHTLMSSEIATYLIKNPHVAAAIGENKTAFLKSFDLRAEQQIKKTGANYTTQFDAMNERIDMRENIFLYGWGKVFVTKDDASYRWCKSGAEIVLAKSDFVLLEVPKNFSETFDPQKIHFRLQGRRLSHKTHEAENRKYIEIEIPDKILKPGQDYINLIINIEVPETKKPDYHLKVYAIYLKNL